MKNREIKFRAWDIKAEKMSPPFTLFGEFLLIGAIHSWQRESGITGDSLGRLNDLAIMQFTGLKEHCNENPSDNREIYEGDVVELLNETLVVEWNDDICQFQFSDGTPINDGERYGVYKKIIGNAFENPDLLK